MHQILEELALDGGVASTIRLQTRGVPLVAITRAVRAGEVLRLRYGWIALPDAPEEVVRAVRVGGRLSCLSVLRHEKLWCARDERLHVRVASAARGLSAPHSRSVPLGDPEQWGVALHRTRRSYRLDEPVGPVDTLEWALLHAVGCQSKADAIVTLDSALNTGRVSTPELAALLGELPRSYQRYLDLVDPTAQSGLETKARLGLRRYNIPYASQVEIPGAGRVDLLVGERLVIELDGREFHATDEAYDDERRRDLALIERGYLILRLSYEQVMQEWGRVIALVRQLVAWHEHRWGLRHRRAGLVPLE